ncbi:MAG: glutamine--tRNA ligase/YqeY domain fusion protein [Chitinophagaceae bacterium]|nr:MAG: glutamine--tRNA ligase/YqeY domain fusion protein [Chitinophagaceae bacterium]
MSEDNKVEEKSLNFLEEIIEKDLADGKYQQIVTRFPPEPNGYLHMGHASSICLNFGLANKYGGYTNLRFDDTNPVTEDTEYVESIKNDIQWLGFQWKNEYYASDYFETLYDYAVKLINKGLAYVDDSTSEAIAQQKGTPTTPGIRNSYAERSVEENLQLFAAMREGKYADGSKVLRAKIDMNSSNMLMRDPIIYRIKHAHHHRTGDAWCIYPMYDFAHGQSDSIENITHSICTMEFVPHREVYDWLIKELDIYPSHQYEFARRNMSHTVMSKRKLLQLVNEGFVNGWDDPRMPTISGFRRRGYTPKSIREFANRIGVGKRENMVDLSLLEFCVREDLNNISLRRMVVMDPIKIVITNFEKDAEVLVAENNPENELDGTREIIFGKEIFIEREDFMENPPKKYFRLAPGQMVRLKHAYIIQCNEIIKDDKGEIIQIHCTYIPESKSGSDTSGIKVKGTLHWVNASPEFHIPVQINEYDRLFTVEDPSSEEGDFKSFINQNSLKIINTAKAEPALADALLDQRFQFLRKGYYTLDNESSIDNIIFNRTVTLKDSWAKENK